MIKAIIFDCFGVLYGTSFEHVQSIAPKDRKIELQDIRIQHDRGYLSQTEFLKKVADIIGWTPERVGDYMRQQHVLNDELVEYIVELKKEYKIGMLSNVGHGWIKELFSEELSAKLFDSIVASDTVHMIKPEPEIYEYAARELNMLPNECVFIDDSPRNVDGAIAVGMKAILFSENNDMIEKLSQLGVENARTARG